MSSDAPSILVVDDSPVDLEIISIVCDALGCSVDVASNGLEAIKLYEQKHHALVLTDYVMEPMNGIYLTSLIKELNPGVNCIMVTGFPDQTLRRFIEENDIVDLVMKPIQSASLKETLRLALNRGRGATGQTTGIALSNRMDVCGPLVGEGEAIRKLREQVTDCTASNQPLLLQGPVGVGKLQIANFIHQNGRHGGSSCVEVPCASMDETTLRRDLIAADGRWGTLLNQAKNGTLILRNIEVLPLAVQRNLAAAFDEIAAAMYVITIADNSAETALERGDIDAEFYFKIAIEQIDVPLHSA
jgi:DNA-binding NtrC family response regulator